MGTSCPVYELSWIRVVLGTSFLGYELSWVRVVLGMSCPGYELSWVRVVQIPDHVSLDPNIQHIHYVPIGAVRITHFKCQQELCMLLRDIYGPKVRRSPLTKY